MYSPSACGFALSLKEARNRVRSLKLQLFCTFVGLGDSAGTSSPDVVRSGGARYCFPRELCRGAPVPRIRSFSPTLALGS